MFFLVRSRAYRIQSRPNLMQSSIPYSARTVETSAKLTRVLLEERATRTRAFRCSLSPTRARVPAGRRPLLNVFSVLFGLWDSVLPLGFRNSPHPERPPSEPLRTAPAPSGHHRPEASSPTAGHPRRRPGPETLRAACRRLATPSPRTTAPGCARARSRMETRCIAKGYLDCPSVKVRG